MNFPLTFSFLNTLGCVVCSTCWAAPKVQILSGETVVAMLGALAGTLQVQADKTHFDTSTGQVRLKGNVVLTTKDARGRLATVRASDAVLSSPDVEFQIIDYTRQENGRYVDALGFVGNEGGVVESVLLRKVQQHAGFSSYRLRFSGIGAGAGTSGVILYQRGAKTLKIYSIFNYPSAGILAITDVTYHGVSPDILQKALSFRNEKGELRRDKYGQVRDPGLQDLKKYGATTVDNSRRYNYKEPT